MRYRTFFGTPLAFYVSTLSNSRSANKKESHIGLLLTCASDRLRSLKISHTFYPVFLLSEEYISGENLMKTITKLFSHLIKNTGGQAMVLWAISLPVFLVAALLVNWSMVVAGLAELNPTTNGRRSKNLSDEDKPRGATT